MKSRPARLRLLLAGLLVTPLVACGGTGEAPDEDHEPVSVAPSATTTATSEPPLEITGVASEQLEADAFGMHVNRLAEEFWPDTAIGAFRIWNADSTWGGLEPSPGSWDFAALDQRVAQATERGASIMLVLSHPPTWAATHPEVKKYGGSPSPPRDFEAWRTYVRTVVERYAGRIEAYEVWNEPNLPQFYMGTPAELGELTQIASEEIRGADPAALVVSSGLSARTGGATAFFTSYLAATPPDAIDVVGMHIYPNPGQGPEAMLALVGQLRAIADAAGHADKPMWNTEIGYGRAPDTLFVGPTALSVILRTFLVLPANGVSRNYWYAWDDRQFIGLFMVEDDFTTETEYAEAYAEAARWLVGAAVTECADTGGGLWSCSLIKDGQAVTIAWKLGGTVSYPAPEGTTLVYPFAGESSSVGPGAQVELGELPLLFAPAEIPSLGG